MTTVISGRPARCIANRFTALGDDMRDGDIAPYPMAYDARKVLNLAAKAKSEHGYGAQWAGQAAALAREMPASDLMITLRRELEAANVSR